MISAAAVAIVINCSSSSQSNNNNGEEEGDNFLTSPALQSATNAQLDQHPAVKMLERAKVFRHVMISARDGTLLNGLGLSDLALPMPVSVMRPVRKGSVVGGTYGPGVWGNRDNDDSI
mmetsp:Transcript_4468/g.9490  ORF Transcript_4468/g.9490 Transcript_4468/m.9490 type:complete len:118 (+) Transcript_4468:703-1056(+)